MRLAAGVMVTVVLGFARVCSATAVTSRLGTGDTPANAPPLGKRDAHYAAVHEHYRHRDTTNAADKRDVHTGVAGQMGRGGRDGAWTGDDDVYYDPDEESGAAPAGGSARVDPVFGAVVVVVESNDYPPPPSHVSKPAGDARDATDDAVVGGLMPRAEDADARMHRFGPGRLGPRSHTDTHTGPASPADAKGPRKHEPAIRRQSDDNETPAADLTVHQITRPMAPRLPFRAQFMKARRAASVAEAADGDSRIHKRAADVTGATQDGPARAVASSATRAQRVWDSLPIACACILFSLIMVIG
ncbi:hypothetical protein BC831DRAFT_476993 [Entophlyctis helioformis]|nr:hypothetical protein BC831DRAFT_476993 [Entophlyctis helioformis]